MASRKKSSWKIRIVLVVSLVGATWWVATHQESSKNVVVDVTMLIVKKATH